jgi:branched-chain amino acid transport system substrate-binding protein
VPVQPPASNAVRLGVILPMTGGTSLSQYSSALLDGITIAADERADAGGQRVVVVMKDDGGSATQAAAMMREVEKEGVVAVIGPITNATFDAAAHARANPDLVMIAPAMMNAPAAANAYALNHEDTAGAVLLAKYAASLKRKTGVIYEARGARARDAAAFIAAYTAATGKAPAAATFTGGTTTFATQIRKLRDARVEVIYLPLAASTIPQLLPQLGYYGLEKAQVLGGETWMTESLRRSVPAKLMEGVVATTILPRDNPDVAYRTFEQAYQQANKRSLTSVIPALGYDAARLVLDALPARGAAKASDVARNLPRMSAVRGATGVLRVNPGIVSRSPFLVRSRGGVWEPVNSGVR